MAEEFQQKPMTVSLFTNKRTTNKQPLLRGDVMIDLKELGIPINKDGWMNVNDANHLVKLQISLWGKYSEKTGTDYWQGNVQLPRERNNDRQSDAMPPIARFEPTQSQEPGSDAPSDDLPSYDPTGPSDGLGGTEINDLPF